MKTIAGSWGAIACMCSTGCRRTLAAEWYPVFRARLDERFVAALADETLKPDWQIPVKLTHGRAGSQGMVLVGEEGVVYKSSEAGESRTWRMRDLENVSSSGASI